MTSTTTTSAPPALPGRFNALWQHGAATLLTILPLLHLGLGSSVRTQLEQLVTAAVGTALTWWVGTRTGKVVVPILTGVVAAAVPLATSGEHALAGTSILVPLLHAAAGLLNQANPNGGRARVVQGEVTRVVDEARSGVSTVEALLHDLPAPMLQPTSGAPVAREALATSMLEAVAPASTAGAAAVYTPAPTLPPVPAQAAAPVAESTPQTPDTSAPASPAGSPTDPGTPAEPAPSQTTEEPARPAPGSDPASPVNPDPTPPAEQQAQPLSRRGTLLSRTHAPADTAQAVTR